MDLSRSVLRTSQLRGKNVEGSHLNFSTIYLDDTDKFDHGCLGFGEINGIPLISMIERDIDGMNLSYAYHMEAALWPLDIPERDFLFPQTEIERNLRDLRMSSNDQFDHFTESRIGFKPEVRVSHANNRRYMKRIFSLGVLCGFPHLRANPRSFSESGDALERMCKFMTVSLGPFYEKVCRS